MLNFNINLNLPLNLPLSLTEEWVVTPTKQVCIKLMVISVE